MSDIPHGTIFGRRVGNPPKSDAEHFIRCPACGGWFDCRDLGQAAAAGGSSRLRRTNGSGSVGSMTTESTT